MGPHTIDGKDKIIAKKAVSRSLESSIEYASRMCHGQTITFGALTSEDATKLIEWLSSKHNVCWFEYIKRPASFVVKFHSSTGPASGVVSNITDVFYQCYKMLPGEKCTFNAWAYFVKCIPTIENDLKLINGKSYLITHQWKKKGGLYQLNIVCQ